MPAHDSRPRPKERHCAYCDRTFTKEEHLKRHQRTHTGEKPFKCQRCHRKYSRSDVLARHIQTHHPELLGNGRPSFRVRAGVLETCPTQINTDIYTRTGNSGSDDSTNQPEATDIQRLGTSAISAQRTGYPPPAAEQAPSVSNIWNETRGRGLDEGLPQQQWHIADPDTVSNLPWQIMPDQEFLAAAQPLSYATDQQAISLHHNHERQPEQPRLAGADGTVADSLITGMELDGFCHLSPGILNYVDFPLTPTPQPSRGTDEPSDTLKLPFTADQVQRLRPLWGTQRVAPVLRLCPTLWRTVIWHGADNIFSVPSIRNDDRSAHNMQSHGWNIDEQDRKRLVEFCEVLVNAQSQQDDSGFGGPSPQRSHSSAQSLPSEVAVAELPSKEVLNASIDFFFQSFHYPFIHKATFHPRSTPSPLLLLMCLVGFAALYRERSTGYVVQYLTRLMAFCRHDLTDKSLGRCQPLEVLSTIASALLVVYLALGFLEELDDGQAHLLCSQILQLAEKHGLFAAGEADDPNSQLQTKPGDQDSYWKAWARVESIKRMLNYLIWLDMAYTRMVGTTGSVDVGNLDLHLPCDAILFESSTPTRFFHLAQGGAPLAMPRMQIHDFHTCGPADLDSVSMQTLLSALLVQIVTLRNKIPVGCPLILDGSDAYTVSGMDGANGRESIIPGNIIPSLLSVPTKYAKVFQGKDVINALAWNNVCVALTADISLLEVSFGRDGIHATQSAMSAVTRWTRTVAARRAAIHAAQMFEILSSARLSESNVARPDQMLYASALVLSMYLFASDAQQGDKDDAPPVFELLQDIDWAAIDGEGIAGVLEQQDSSYGVTAPMSPDSQNLNDSTDAARHFIRHGGPVSFAGEVQQDGGSALKKAMLNYVHLLEDIGKYRGSKYTRLLKTMCDFVIEEAK